MIDYYLHECLKGSTIASEVHAATQREGDARRSSAGTQEREVLEEYFYASSATRRGARSTVASALEWEGDELSTVGVTTRGAN